MMDQVTLVTGGCGFVGRHVVGRSLKENRHVWIVDDLSTGQHPDAWLSDFERMKNGSEALVTYQSEDAKVVFFETDVREFFRNYLSENTSALGSQLKYPKFSDVIHLASIVGGRAVIDGDPIAVAADLAIDADFFCWAIQARPKHILYTSSSAAYPINLQGTDGAIPLREEMIQFDGTLGQPDMTYGWSKLTGEYLARITAKHYGLHVACVRPFSGYGEDQDDTYPVPAIAARAARRENPLVVWGSGKQGRDFVHIEDCLDAMFIAMREISDGTAVNIGSGVLTTFEQVASIFARNAGYVPVIKPLKEMPTGVHARYADIEFSYNRLNWKPKVSLEEGFQRVFKAACDRVDKSSVQKAYA